MNKAKQQSAGWRKLAAAVLTLALACTGCARLGMSAREVALLEAATADARFVDRAWAGLSHEERREFVRANALRWGYFNDLAHGRQPALQPDGRPAIGPARAIGGSR